MIIALASRRKNLASLLHSWGIVFLGNLVGSLGFSVMLLLSRQYTYGAGAVGETAWMIANTKVQLGSVQVIVLGVLSNLLVCLALWLTFAAHGVGLKIIAIIFPIAACAAAGFEHSVANMFFIPFGLLIKQFDTAFVASLGDNVNLASLTCGNFFLKIQLPVPIGNIIGGTGVVGWTNCAIYLRDRKRLA